MNAYVNHTITRERFNNLIKAIGKARVSIIGDACLDIYWEADMRLSSLARENPHHFLPVVNERLSPGGGGNTAFCAATLTNRKTALLSLLSHDWRGDELLRKLIKVGIRKDYLIFAKDRITPAFCKPLRRGYIEQYIEDPHIYFQNHHPIDENTEAKILAKLDKLAKEADALIVTDYLQNGVITKKVRDAISSHGASGLKVIVDSRNHITDYHHVILKPNDIELMQAVGKTLPSMMDIKTAAERIAKQCKSSVCVTLGEKGCLWTNGHDTVMIPTTPVSPPFDIVGAGDCFAAAFASALAAGATGPESAVIANLAGAVVVKKIGTTGTASRKEIIAKFNEAGQ